MPSVTVPAVPAEPLTEPEIVDETVKPVNVPTDVIFGCAAVVTVPVTNVPLRLPPVILPVALIFPVTDNKLVALLNVKLALAPALPASLNIT